MKFNFKKIINLNVLLIFLSISQSIQKLSAQFDITLTNPKKNWGEFFKKIKEIGKLDTFIESGTYLGDTTALALPHFSKLHTIEIIPEIYSKSCKRFQQNDTVKLHLGNSTQVFSEILPETKQNKIVFWLDGHQMTALENSAVSKYMPLEFTPILHELDEIIKNKLEKSIILIDDIRLFGTILHQKRIIDAGNSNYPLLNDICRLFDNTNYSYFILGDILLAYDKSILLTFSPIIKACTISRLYDESNYDIETLLESENIISKAKGEELESIIELHKDFSMEWPNSSWKGWKNKSPHYNLWYGLTLQNSNEDEKAYAQFQEAIKLGYDHWRIMWYCAKSLYNLKKFDETKNYLEIVLTNNPNFMPAKELLEKIQ